MEMIDVADFMLGNEWKYTALAEHIGIEPTDSDGAVREKAVEATHEWARNNDIDESKLTGWDYFIELMIEARDELQ